MEENDAARSEKMAVNIGVMELAQIDLLVDNVFYTNRSEFVRTAVRALLERHRQDIDNLLHHPQKAGNDISLSVTLGVNIISRRDLTSLVDAGKKLRVRVVGVLRVDSDVTPELVAAGVESCRVYGKLLAGPEVKKALEKLS